jgi:hypothetical protein
MSEANAILFHEDLRYGKILKANVPNRDLPKQQKMVCFEKNNIDCILRTCSLQSTAGWNGKRGQRNILNHRDLWRIDSHYRRKMDQPQ